MRGGVGCSARIVGDGAGSPVAAAQRKPPHRFGEGKSPADVHPEAGLLVAAVVARADGDTRGQAPDAPRQENAARRECISKLSAAILRPCASLDLDTVLREIVDSARALTGARSARRREAVRGPVRAERPSATGVSGVRHTAPPMPERPAAPAIAAARITCPLPPTACRCLSGGDERRRPPRSRCRPPSP